MDAAPFPRDRLAAVTLLVGLLTWIGLTFFGEIQQAKERVHRGEIERAALQERVKALEGLHNPLHGQ